jgi:hypothetical protein
VGFAASLYVLSTFIACCFVSPEAISTMVLKHVKTAYAAAMHKSVDEVKMRAVVTVPGRLRCLLAFCFFSRCAPVRASSRSSRSS